MRFIARQPIVDKDRQIFAHELFFASSSGGGVASEDPERPTVPITLDDVTDDHLAFVNLSEEALVTGAARKLPPNTTVIEVLETVRPTGDVIEACRQLRRDGFRIALDDFLFRPELQSLVDLADFIKVEWPDVTKVLSLVRGKRLLQFVVERIETEAQLVEAVAEGFDFFQGYHLGRPKIVTGIELDRVDQLCRLFGQVGSDDGEGAGL